MTHQVLRTVSLCSGVGGLDMGVDLVAPVELLACADPDPDASLVLAHHFSTVPNLGDIRVVNWELVRDQVAGDVDLVTAGYPCQPFSIAGRRNGIDDERHLYPFVSDAVRSLRPRLVFLENVPNHRKLGFAEVLADLTEIGYRVAWCSVRASDVGAPHRRERLFILAVATDSDSDSVRTEQESVSRSGDEILVRGDRQASPDSSSIRLETSDRFCVTASPQDSRVLDGDSDTRGVDWGQYSRAIRRWERIRRSIAPYPVAYGPRGGRRVSNEFGEWVMGYPSGWISSVPGINLRAGAKLYGNGVVPQAAARAFEQNCRNLVKWSA